MNDFLDKLPFAQRTWFLYLRLLVRHFLDDNCTQKAASLTYTTLLSVVPMIAVLLVIFSTVPALESVREQMQQAIYSNLLPSSSSQISAYLNGFAEKSVKMSVVGVGVLLFTTIMTLITIETAFNQIWRVENQTGGVASVVRFFLMVIGLPITLGVAFLASSAVQSIDFLNRQIGGYGIDWGVWVEIFSFLVMVLGFVGMYWFVPKIKVPLKNALIAGVVVAVVFECVKRVFGLLIANFTSYEAVYGAFAALPIFLVWIYASWNLILLGVEISYTLTIFDTKEVPVRHPLLSLLDMLNVVFKNHQDNKSTSEAELRAVLDRKELPKWQVYIAQLMQNQLLLKLDNDEYTLKTDLDSMNLWEFYRVLPYPLPIKDELIQLRMAAYDPWYIEIYQRLMQVQGSAKAALNVPLAALLRTAPIRPKRHIVVLQTHNMQHADDVGGKQASFDDTAIKTKVDDDTDNDIIIPRGIAYLTEGKWGRVARHIKTARHWTKRAKSIIQDIKKQ